MITIWPLAALASGGPRGDSREAVIRDGNTIKRVRQVAIRHGRTVFGNYAHLSGVETLHLVTGRATLYTQDITMAGTPVEDQAFRAPAIARVPLGVAYALVFTEPAILVLHSEDPCDPAAVHSHVLVS